MADRWHRGSVPGTSLSTQSRPVNVQRLLNAVAELDTIADVATGKLTRNDVALDWLRPLASPEPDGVPHPLLTRWINLFRDDLETVRRARNNIVFNEYIEDDNLAAAADIADRLRNLARQAAQTADTTNPSGRDH
jgi:hypothetical protein